ncbi:MAG: carbohydrate kinase family protein [Nitrospiria bacterium]
MAPSQNTTSSSPARKRILTIGSGTVEYVLKPGGDHIEWGGKHTADITTLYGGSGVNYAMRLLSAGLDAFPILAIGHDEAALKIQQTLLSASEKGGGSPAVARFLQPDDPTTLFNPDIRTSHTVIFAHGAQRTLFTQAPKKNTGILSSLKHRIQSALDAIGDDPDAVMIGHLHSDAKNTGPHPGAHTQYVIDMFKGRASLFANFGNSQIELGLDFWKPALSHIDLFQLNLEEARRFFSNGRQNATLVQVVDRIRSLGLNAVITLDKFGAVGIYRDKPESIILAWPLIDGTEIVDATGAGDAFGAGLVSRLCRRGQLDFSTFHEAIETARTWSALACTSLGGCSDCPDQHTLDAYQLAHANGKSRPVEIKDHHYAAEIMSLIDIAFSEAS